MNKELEALNHLVNLAVGVGFREKVFTSKEIILKALKRNEPMLVLESDINFCPNCGESLFDYIKQNYCDACGQKLDWEDK